MDSSFQVQTQGLVVFGSFMCNNNNTSELYWNNSFRGCEKLTSLDGKNEDVGNKSAGFRKKDKLETKNLAASRNHCAAERRRRERINGHLATLRDFLPCVDKVKMDKATLLAKVIAHVKMLQQQALEATKGLIVPTDIDEIIVVPYNDEPIIEDGCLVFKASICCRYKSELIPDIRQAINNLKLTIIKAEISTLEGRVKSVLIINGSEKDIGYDNRGQFAKLIEEALCNVLDKLSKLDEFSPMIVMNKRRKVSSFEPSTSSSSF